VNYLNKTVDISPIAGGSWKNPRNVAGKHVFGHKLHKVVGRKVLQWEAIVIFNLR
jgi:hypothetical protein